MNQGNAYLLVDKYNLGAKLNVTNAPIRGATERTGARVVRAQTTFRQAGCNKTDKPFETRRPGPAFAGGRN
jgi:hypothetical protein